MKPFNLEAALNGAKMTTRDGREVKQLTRFDVSWSWCPVRAVVDDMVESFMLNGRYCSGLTSDDNPFDLFMADGE